MKKRILYILLFTFSLLFFGCVENKEDVFSVTFETFGGQYIATQKIKSGEHAIRPVDPIKKDHDFNGWFSDNNFNNEFIFEEVKITSDTTIYAKFIAIGEVESFNVKFIDGESVLHQAIYNKGAIVNRPTDPTKEGYRFLGWYLNDELYNFETSVSSNLVLIAKYEKIEDDPNLETYTVKFTHEDNTVISEVNYNKGETIVKPNNPVKYGYEFLGWYLNDVLFTFNIPATEDLIIIAKFKKIEVVDPTVDTYEITLNASGGTIETTLIIVEENEVFTLPVPTHPEGLTFIGWFDENNQQFTSNKATRNMTLYAKYEVLTEGGQTVEHGTYPEAIWIEIDAALSDISVRYKLSDTTTYKLVDQELVRIENNTTLIDILGLKAGNYDVEIVINSNEVINLQNINVKAHDRSGYAHFNYTEGIGAYKDDGTLKDNAVVIYVTEENKNTITIDGIDQVGLGWILNNAQYSSSSSSTYNPTKYNNSLAKFNRPIIFRFIGKITAPEGLTVYNSTVNGGSIGDNGFMARIKDANHITIEGVGQGAEIFGWGIHFMAATAGRGVGFEVRNITFDKYPEDALGLEGVQSGGVLTAPVQRGWIHNTTFKQGFCATPAESDKAYGDGSLDIKRGEYFTISYNQFIDARKTNLIGASDSNLTYHLTYHHNLWMNAVSRTPLTRKANVHMYNNVFVITDDNTGETGYAMNTRADAYIFSEANYFHAIKNPFRVDGGAIKSYGDVLYSTYEAHNQVTVSSREELVNTNNKYNNFDTNKNVFYYDEINKKSDVLHLTDAITAKKEVFAYSGTYRKVNVINDVDHYVTNMTPVQVTETVTIPGGKIQKGIPFYVFEISANAQFEMVEGTASYRPRLVNIYGEEMLTGTGSVSLTPGIYVLESEISHGSSKGRSQAKESAVTSFTITLDTYEIKQQRIDNFNEALDNIPVELVYSDHHISLVVAAETAYNQLTEDEKLSVEGAQLQTAVNNLISLGKTHIEGLINDIGVVTEDSYNKIHLARTTYNKARLEIRDIVSNYQTLVNAENEFKAFEVTNLINSINDAPSYGTINRTNKTEVTNLNNIYLELETRYLSLAVEDQATVTNYSKVTTNITELELMLMAHDIKELVNLVVDVKDYLDEIIEAHNNYQTLSVDNKSILTETEVNELNSLYTEAQKIKNQRVEQFYHFEGTNPYFSVESGNGCDVSPSQTYNGIEISRGLKLESSTKITFNAESNFRIVMKFIAGESIKIDGVVVPIVNNEIVLDLTAGTHLITRDGNPQARLVYIVVIENY